MKRYVPPAWPLICLGVWVMAAPWVLGFSGINLALWSSTLSGGLVIIVALWRPSESP